MPDVSDIMTTFSIKNEPEDEQDQAQNDKLYVNNFCTVIIKKEDEYAIKTELWSRQDQLLDIKSEDSSFKSSHCPKLLVEAEKLTAKKIKRYYVCPICRNDFPSRSTSQKHLESHFGRHCLICPHCGDMFVEKTDYIFHRLNYLVNTKRKKEMARYKCNICCKTFWKKRLLDDHLLFEHNDPEKLDCRVCLEPFQCVDDLTRHLFNIHRVQPCFRTFSRRAKLKQHRSLHTGTKRNKQLTLKVVPKKVLRSKVCDTYFDQWGDLKKHMDDHYNTRRYKCEICPQFFTQQTQFTKHMLVHSGATEFACEICSKVVYSKSILQRHALLHSGEKQFACDVCTKRFTQRTHLKVHQLTHLTEKPFNCDVCSRGFNSNARLKKHSKIHSDNKPFQCYTCLKSFTTKTYLDRHLLIHIAKVHTGEKPFQCEVCLKRFSRRSRLKSHASMHAATKETFDCKICGENFHFKKRLTDRFATHQGHSQFVCGICSKSFAREQSLNVHQRVHTGEKSFQCDMCDKKFTARNTLNVHKHIHTGEKPFACKVCSKEFGRRSSLRAHVKRHEKQASAVENKIFPGEGNEADFLNKIKIESEWDEY